MKLEFLISNRFAAVEHKGKIWYAIRPVVVAAELNYHYTFQKIQKHPTLSKIYRNFSIDVTSKGITQERSLAFLPEDYFYGWLFTLPFESEEGLAFQKECFQMMHLYFK